jgi:TonB-linked SusC/RagA family outer membrane protein
MRKILLMLGLLFTCAQLFAQNRTVTGKVTDANGADVPGASVVVKGTTSGTVTNASGTFTLSIPSTAKILVISSTGMTSKEIDITAASSYTVQLAAASGDLQTVVVTGYSREKKSQFVGAATTLTAKAVETVPVGAFDQMLQGRVPGMQVNSGTGQPGSSANVRIRGTSSLGGQTQPLYVIDGVPVLASDFATLNPNDFESITVLKDASASALYGARGGLGVVVITTKSGRAGQTVFTVRSQFGITQRLQPTQFYQMNTQQMLDYEEFVGQFSTGLVAPGWSYSRKNPAYNVLQTGFTSLAQQQARYDFLRDSFSKNNLDYYDLLFRTGSSRTNEINMSGGNAGTRYFLSLGNFNQEGTDRKSRLNRYTLRFNMDNTVGKLTTRINSTIGYSITDYNEGAFYAANGTANPFAMVWRAKPYENPYDASGNLIFGTSSANSPKALGNLIERSNNSTWIEKQFKATAGLTLAYKIIPQLTVRNTFGVDASHNYAQGAINANSYVGSLQTYNAGYLNEALFNRLQLINTTGVIYANRFGAKHDLEVGGYFEAIRNWNNGSSFVIYNLDPRLNQTGQGAGSLPTNGATTIAQNGSSAKSGSGIRSLFANARYTYNNKYTFSGSLRRDGTSRIINEDNREITTWAAGVTWDAIREDFLKDQSVLSNLRLRASYGSVPNIGSIPGGGAYGIGGSWYTVPKYLGAQEPAFTPVGFAGSPISAVAPTAVNPDLRIEMVEKTNIGVELGFLKNRIQLTVEAYKNTTKDLFVNQSLVASSGFYGNSLAINAGTMENKGFEFDLTVDVIRTSDIDLTLRGNHAINKNKIVDLGTVSEYVSGTAIVRKGLPVGSHYSYAYLGADPATGRPLYKRPDGTPTTNINEAGQFAEFGSHLPVHTGGFSATFRYRQFTIDALFSYQFDVRRYNNVQNWVTNGDLTYTGAVTQSQILLTDQWQRPGDVKMIQSPSYSKQFTSYDITDAKFLRFRNLNVSYNLAGIGVGNTKIFKSARIYVQGQNLFVWSPWSGLDPEDDNNISLGEFPNPRAFVAGIDINF